MPVKPPENSEDTELDDESVDFARGPAPVKDLEPPPPFHSEAQVLFNSQSRLRISTVAPAEDGPVSALAPANVSNDQPKLVPLRIEPAAKVAAVTVVEDAPVSALEPVNVPTRTNPEVQTVTVKAKEQPVTALNALNTVVEYSKTSVAAVLNTSGFAVLDPTTHAAVKATVPVAYDTAAKIVAPFTQTKEQPKEDKPSTAKVSEDGPVSALEPANVSKDVPKVTPTVRKVLSASS